MKKGDQVAMKWDRPRNYLRTDDQGEVVCQSTLRPRYWWVDFAGSIRRVHRQDLQLVRTQ